MTGIIVILLPVAFFALFIWVARLARELNAISAKKSQGADGELGKIRENIEQLLDVLEERSQATEGQLRRLIDEAKEAAKQIDEATASAVKMLERASTGAGAAQAAPETPTYLAPEAIAPEQVAEASLDEGKMPQAIQAEPTPQRGVLEPELAAEAPIDQSAPVAAAVATEEPAPVAAIASIDAPAEVEEPAQAVDAPLAQAPEREVEASVAEPVSRPEVVSPVAEAPLTPSGLNPVPTDAFFGAKVQSKAPAQGGSEPARVAPSAARTGRGGAMPPVHEVFTPWPGETRSAPAGSDVAQESAAVDADGAAGASAGKPKRAARANGTTEPAATPNGSKGSAPEAQVSDLRENTMLSAEDAAPPIAGVAIDTGEPDDRPADDIRDGPANGALHANDQPGEDFRPFEVKAQPLASNVNIASENAENREGDTAPVLAAPAQELPASAREDARANGAHKTGDSPARDPYSAVYTLTERGVTDVAEIARRTGLGQTEVEMVLDLWRRQ